MMKPGGGFAALPEAARHDPIRRPQKKKQNNTTSTAAAVASFNDNSSHDANRVYCEITGQAIIPSDQIDSALATMTAILPTYQGRNGDAIKDGKRIFSRWCNTKGNTGIAILKDKYGLAGLVAGRTGTAAGIAQV